MAPRERERECKSVRARQLRQTKGRHENFRYPCLTTVCVCECARCVCAKVWGVRGVLGVRQ